jgi:glycosyltransferase involved in cell wall biosynthesis
MNIVHLLIGGELRGGEAVALRLARAARARGDDVSFVSPDPGPFVDLAAADGFHVDLVPLRRSYQLGAAVRLGRVLRRRRADVLHTHVQAAAGAPARVAARLVGVRVVAHLHIENHFRPRGVRRGVLRTLDNVTARLCARAIAVSEATLDAFVRQGWPERMIEVVYNGVDIVADAPSANGAWRRALSVPDDAPVVAEIARLCDVKGQRELIAALADVPDARLVLVGGDLEAGGAFQAELERAADRLGVRDRVVFAGYRADAAELLSDVDVFALPSWTEGLPITVLEAMARSRPVVATPVGGTPEVVADGETGLLVPPQDPTALAAALRRLLADPELRRRMGEAGRRRVEERFSAREMTDRVLAVYDEVAS